MKTKYPCHLRKLGGLNEQDTILCVGTYGACLRKLNKLEGTDFQYSKFDYDRLVRYGCERSRVYYRTQSYWGRDYAIERGLPKA